MSFTFTAQKPMYGGKRIAAGDTVFAFACENQNEGSAGLVASGEGLAAEAASFLRGFF